MNTKMIMGAAAALGLMAQGLLAQDYNTITIEGATWANEGVISGTFTYAENNVGAPNYLVSMDLTTTLGTDFYYSAPGHSDTVTSYSFDLTEGVEMYGFDPAGNEINVHLASGYMNLDFTDAASDPLFAASSPMNSYFGGAMTSAGTSYSTLAAPEPSTLALAGVGAIAIGWVKRRKTSVK